MAPQDATQLINWIPRTSDCIARGGYVAHSTGVGADDVDSLIEYNHASSRVLLAASTTNIYDVTTAGTASSLAGSFTSGFWQHAIMNGVMGLVNGADAPQTFDGSSVAAMTVSGTTVAELIGINVFKSRSYFWKSGSPSFWYSGTNTLGGALTEFALGQVARTGGDMVAMGNWSVDGGAGPDDYAVFVLSSGEVIVYTGDDPGTATSWELVGSYTLPEPVNSRCLLSIGRELAMLTQSDLVFMPSAFGQPAPPESKLSGAIVRAVGSYSSNTGFQMSYYRNKGLLIINVPTTSTTAEQYIVNIRTGAPARWDGYNAKCFATLDGELYFGGLGDGIVYQADVGDDDAGENINLDAYSAWNAFGSLANKAVTGVKTRYAGTTNFNLSTIVAYDFQEQPAQREITTGGGATPWGSPWGSPWGAQQTARAELEGTNGHGEYVSAQTSLGVQDELPILYGWEFYYELTDDL